MTTARYLIANSLHMFGIIDATEAPQDSDLTMCVPLLNDMFRSDYMDAG